jgi:hypothetical protein
MHIDPAELHKLERELVDRGLLIEAGWIGLRIAAISPDASQLEMRGAFFAGAQHLFASILGVLDGDAEPTEQDLRRMDMVAKELETFINEFSKKHGLTT